MATPAVRWEAVGDAVPDYMLVAVRIGKRAVLRCTRFASVGGSVLAKSNDHYSPFPSR